MTKEELIKINGEFLSEHYEISETDVNMANNYIELIEKTRSDKQPKVGDILQFTNKHGDYYGYAHIDAIKDGKATICERAYTPFISEYDGEIRLSTSGGAWTTLDAKNFKYLGKADKKFCDWGHYGACAHGAIDFIATVNVWEFKEENKFGEYTTKDYKKQYINILDNEAMEKRQSNYRVLGDGNAWETIEEYEDYKKLYNGAEFDGYWDNQKVLFTWKEKRIFIENPYTFEDLPLKSYVILDNGSKYKAKVSKDVENKIVLIFINRDCKYDINNYTWEEYHKIPLYKEVIS